MNSCLCGHTEAKFLFSAQGYSIVQCSTCGQVRTETTEGMRRTQYYEEVDFSIYIEKEQTFRSLFRTVIAFIQQFKKTGKLLDIGAGVGLLVSEAQRVGFKAVGVEPSKSSVRAAKRYLGITLVPKEFSVNVVRDRFDVVVLNHVLEHVPDPNSIIGGIAKILNKNGLLVIGVPNFGSYLSILKRDRWQSLIPDQHRWHFTLLTLDQLVTPFGFERQGVSWENHDRTMHYWWKKPIYWILDQIALRTRLAEAMLVIYKKIL